MKAGRSLVRALTLRFALVAFFGTSIATFTYALLKPVELEYELGDLARELVERVVMDGNGRPAVVVESGGSLIAWLSEVNALHVKVFDRADGRVLFAFAHDGGDSTSIDAISSWPPGFFVLGGLTAPEHEYGFIDEIAFDNGAVIRIVARRGPPEARDYFYWMMTELRTELGPLIAIVALVGTVLAVFTVGRGLAPLAAISRQAATLEPGSTRRLDDRGVPEEVRPLVEAMNRALDRLQDALAQQRRFTAVAAHELRTPLAALRARLDGLPADLADRKALLATTERMGRLVDQLLAVARLESGQLRTDERLDLCALVRSVIAERAPRALAAGRELAFEAPPGPLTVHGSRDALERAVGNLLDNALRYSPPGGTVEVRLAADGTLEVLDRGPGFGDLVPEELFRPFVRGGDGPRDPDGAGLGLAIVHDVARLHGGEAFAGPRAGGGAVVGFRIDPRRRPAA